MAQAHSAPLTGYRIAVTSARRAEELCALLRRQGAEVCSAPAIKMIALPDDDELQNNTEALIADPPDILVAHTGIGFRGWLAAAEGWGLANELLESLSSARIISRGPKATGALRAAGLREEWSPDSESSHEVLEYLLESGVSRTRIAVQLHGAADSWDPFPEFLGGLRFAGAQVVPIRVYRWKPAPLGGVFDHLVTGIARRQFDAVTFTSAPAAAAVLERSRELDIEDQLLAALRTDVHAMCVGPVTSRPLSERASRRRLPSECGWEP
ncbi:transcriptional regulator [Mycobacterium tuberculosis]|nr:transcriptional regulator [Mycobacterium tuberculosis]